MKFKKIRSKTNNDGLLRQAGRGWAGVSRGLGAATVLATALAPNTGRPCACGCGFFDVGTASMFPSGQGGMAFLEYDYQDQNVNWSGHSHAPSENNDDKAIQTHFITAGLQYMFNRKWGLQVEVPYANRTFTVTGGQSGRDQITLNWGDLGDIRVRGIYTGFSPEMSSGLSFGVKLPTGNYTYNDAFNDVDRDTEIGTGSTDILLGGFTRQKLGGGFDSGANASGGANSEPENGPKSGFERILLSPGLEIDLHPWRLYTDAEFPIYQHMTGNQLVAPVLFKVSLSYAF